MKLCRLTLLLANILLCAVCLTACQSTNTSGQNTHVTVQDEPTRKVTPTPTRTAAPTATPTHESTLAAISANTLEPTRSSKNRSITFTNKYGTATTKCNIRGCDNCIASSGDTNCCVFHSNKCLECGCYIDNDAIYCMTCLTKAASSYSDSSFTNKYGTPTTKCATSGCKNYIASSGDTNCCVTHSNKCLECKCYIDGDAIYCMSCIMKAFGG